MSTDGRGGTPGGPSGSRLHLDHLPPFANEYNKQLSQSVRETDEYLTRITRELDESQARLDTMLQHLKNVQQELLSSQNLYDAKVRDVATERHLTQIAGRESTRVIAETQKITEEHRQMVGKVQALQSSIFRGTEQVADFKKHMNFTQSQLDQWVATENEKEQDALALAKYTRMDESRIKELSLKLEKLTKEVGKKKAELEAEVTETKAAQIELDKTGVEFKTLHKERQELIRQWESAVDTMRRREEAIEEANKRLEEIDKQIEERKKLLQEQQKFLDGERANNVQVENKISQADRQVAKSRSEYSSEQQELIAFNDEVETLRNTLLKSGSMLETKRAEVAQFREDMEIKAARIVRVKSQHEQTQEMLDSEYSLTGNLEQRSRALDKYMKQEQMKLKTLEKEVSDLKQSSFKHSQALFKLKAQESNLTSEISGAQAAGRNLQSKIGKLEGETLKQMELVYNQEYQLQLLERKISRAQGERSNEEKVALQQRIEGLSRQLETEMATHTLLSNQLRKLDEDLKAARRRLEVSRREQEALELKNNEMTLDNESAIRTLKAVQRTKKETLINESFVRLDVRRLRDILYRRAGDVYNIESRKLQLKLNMEERQAQIKVHMDALNTQLRLLEQDKHQLVKEFKDKEIKVEKLKRKYELLLFRVAPEEGEQDKTQAYYVIKAAQEKEELQREGDALDSTIGAVTKEIEGLQNTLQALTQQNGRLHGLKAQGDMTTDQAAKKSSLEQEYESLTQRLSELKKEVAQADSELQNEQVSLADQTGRVSEMQTYIQAMISRKGALERELDDQTSKLSRAQAQAMKIAKAYRQSRKEEESAIDKELKLYERKAATSRRLYNLGQIATQHPEIGPVLSGLLASLDLELPSEPAPSQPSSRIGTPGVSKPASPVASVRSSRVGSPTASSPPSTRSSIISFPSPKEGTNTSSSAKPSTRLSLSSVPRRPPSPAGSTSASPSSSARSSRPPSPSLSLSGRGRTSATSSTAPVSNSSSRPLSKPSTPTSARRPPSPSVTKATAQNAR